MQTLYQLLNQPAPRLSFAINTTPVSESAHPISPQEVQLWEDFQQLVLDFSVDDIAATYAPACTFRRCISKPSNEAETALAFTLNFALRLDQLGVTIRSQVAEIDGYMDLVLIGDYNAIPIAIKYPRASWTMVTNIAQKYYQEIDNLMFSSDDFGKIIRQLYGYMVRFGARYGVYFGTWFARRQPRNARILEISSRLRPNASRPSVSRCLWYLLSREDGIVDDEDPDDIPYVRHVDPGSSSSGEPASDSSDSSYMKPGEKIPLSSSVTGITKQRKTSLRNDKLESLQEDLSVEKNLAIKTGQMQIQSGCWKGLSCAVI
jgi:hypothetical protein